MFTGIIQTLGTIVTRGPARLVVRPRSSFTGLSVGESVAVDGVCLTVERVKDREISFGLLPETMRVTTLGALTAGSPVNLERALRVGDRLGGHLLLGHVDGVGTILGRSRSGKTVTLQIRVPRQMTDALVPKGPIAVDGVSLTLDPAIEADKIRVHLIPVTLSATSLGKKPVGGRVNIELDLIVKYLRGML